MRELKFDSVAGLIDHLATAQLKVAGAGQTVLDGAARLIEADAKTQIGYYQPEVGEFPAWAPLAESTEAQKASMGAPPDAPLLRTGALYASIQREVQDKEAVVGSTDPVMIYHEFGTSKMPPRPVFGPAVERQRPAITQAIGRTVVNGILGGELAAGGKDYFGGDLPG